MERIQTGKLAQTLLFLLIALAALLLRLVIPGMPFWVADIIITAAVAIILLQISFGAGMIAAVILGLASFVTPQVPVFWLTIPQVLGNCALVAGIASALSFSRRENDWTFAGIGLGVGVLMKFFVLWTLMNKWAIPNFAANHVSDIRGDYTALLLLSGALGCAIAFVYMRAYAHVYVSADPSDTATPIVKKLKTPTVADDDDFLDDDDF